jgi:hypothetical protein
MRVDLAAEADARMRDRIHQAEQQRLATPARASRVGGRRALSDHRWRLRQAAGFGLVRTGLRLLEDGRA